MLVKPFQAMVAVRLSHFYDLAQSEPTSKVCRVNPRGIFYSNFPSLLFLSFEVDRRHVRATMVYLQLLLALTGLAFGVRLPFASERPWTTLATNDFTPNTYQKSPYVANGYFGQRLPVEGAGYWIYHDDGRNEPLKNCTINK